MIQYVFILGLFFAGCTNCVTPKIPTLKSFDCNLSVTVDEYGGFDSDNALKLIRCYESMKYFYRNRDEKFNELHLQK